MKITTEQVLHVARLARLSLSEEQIETMIKNMNSILDYMDQLNEVDTTGVEPTSHTLDIYTVTRPDAAMPSLTNEEALANAPKSENAHFKVPKVIE